MPRVILADDEEFVRHFLKETLEELEYDVVAEVKNGEELIAAMNEHQPDILLLDINMPKMDGLDFLKDHASNYKRTCIIMLTSIINEQYKKNCEIFGAKNFLRKDTHIFDLIRTIQETWGNFKEEYW